MHFTQVRHGGKCGHAGKCLAVLLLLWDGNQPLLMEESCTYPFSSRLIACTPTALVVDQTATTPSMGGMATIIPMLRQSFDLTGIIHVVLAAAEVPILAQQ